MTTDASVALDKKNQLLSFTYSREVANLPSSSALVPLLSDLERAHVLPIFFPDIMRFTNFQAFFIAAALPVVAVADFDSNAIFGAGFQVRNLGYD